MSQEDGPEVNLPTNSPGIERFYRRTKTPVGIDLSTYTGPMRFEVESNGATWSLPTADITLPYDEWELMRCPDRIRMMVESAPAPEDSGV